jgi:hypothetical protein
MVPYYAQEEAGVGLLQRACVTGTMRALQTAVSSARALVFDMGSTTPWLIDRFQDARYVITDRVVNDLPVWAAEHHGDSFFMYRSNDRRLWIGNDEDCAAGKAWGWMQNAAQNPELLAPTQLPLDEWESTEISTLAPQFTSAGGSDEAPWMPVPNMRVDAVHGLHDGHPAIAAALRQLAVLREDIGVALLQRACVTGTMRALQTAVASARALVFVMGSTTPWLTEEFQDARYAITDRVVNGLPVWADHNNGYFMYRSNDSRMWISTEESCAAGEAAGWMNNSAQNPELLVPTQLPLDEWESTENSTLAPQFTSASGTDEAPWVPVPDMRVATVHGLGNDHPAMAAALRQLAALREDIGVALLQRACVTGTVRALRSAVSSARALVSEMGSTTPWLTDTFQDARYVITDRVVNGLPVWADEDGEGFMYHSVNGQMYISDDQDCAAGDACGWMKHSAVNLEGLAPTQLPLDEWQSAKDATLAPQFTSAGGTDEDPWVLVPDMRVTAVHGLDDGNPAMAAALRQLAALTATGDA